MLNSSVPVLCSFCEGSNRSSSIYVPLSVFNITVTAHYLKDCDYNSFYDRARGGDALIYYNIYMVKCSQFAMKYSQSSFKLYTEKELFLFNFDKFYRTDIRQALPTLRIMLYSLAWVFRGQTGTYFVCSRVPS